MCCLEVQPLERVLSDGSASGRPSLRRFALECIAHALETHHPPHIDLDAFSPHWLEPGACFVTLRMRAELRGCVGTFDREQPLVLNVAHMACRAAFEDPRFAPVTRDDFGQLETEISVLSSPQPLAVASRAELLDRLSPGIDGLIVQEGRRRATFLPAVWDSLPEPSDFVDALFQKAGLPLAHWSPRIRFERYEATKVD